MKSFWINKAGNKSLILFFSGWSVEPSQMKFLKSDGYDVAMFYSYSSFEVKEEVDFSKYSEVIAVLYSFGVFVGLNFLEKKGFNGEIFVVNGTMKPIDDQFGIKKIIFEKTFENLNEETFGEFQKNMFLNAEDYKKFILSSTDAHDVNELKQELAFIRNNLEKEIETTLNVKKIFISKRDKIFFFKNQVDFWKKFQLCSC
ncbi:MAG: pimeloyl-ACP methyl esterase BioG family protein [bacterium]